MSTSAGDQCENSFSERDKPVFSKQNRPSMNELPNVSCVASENINHEVPSEGKQPPEVQNGKCDIRIKEAEQESRHEILSVS